MCTAPYTTATEDSRECTVLLYVHVGTFYLMLLLRLLPLMLLHCPVSRLCFSNLNCFLCGSGGE